MQPITWLHVSDLHLRVSQTWSQDVALKAMYADISAMRQQGRTFDFILAAGDLAFSGGAIISPDPMERTEYQLVECFLDALAKAASVPKHWVFSVPGNHDVDRGRQKLCFRGARQVVRNEPAVDELFSS